MVNETAVCLWSQEKLPWEVTLGNDLRKEGTCQMTLISVPVTVFGLGVSVV